MNERIAIIGAGELGQQIAHLGLKNNYHVVGFFDDCCTDNEVMGLPIFGTLNEIDAFAHSFDKLMIGIGYKHFDARKQLYISLSAKYSFSTIIDKSAHIDDTASIGEGCVIYPNVTIDKEVVICPNVLLNLSCNICHNTHIGAHTYISPAVNIAGFVKIGECNFIGIGSTIIDNITISSKVVIGANSLVIRNLNANMGGGICGNSHSQNPTKRTVVFFGATGTIGPYAIEYILSKGFRVVAVGRRDKDNGFFADIEVDYYSVDIADKDAFNKLPTENIYAVVHLAGAVPARMKGYNPQEYIDSIVTGTLNVLNYCIKINADRIIFSQSVADVAYLYGSNQPIHADADRKFPENNDHTIYSICKNAAINLIEHYYVKYGLKYFVLRFPNIYLYHPNPYYYYDGKQKWQSYRLLIEKAKKGETIELWGDPNIRRDIVYVKDCAQIIKCALSSNVMGGIYNVGTGVGISMREQINGIVEVFSENVQPSKIVDKPCMPNSPAYIMDISKTISELGYHPCYDYLAYLRDMKKEMKLNRFELLWGKDLLTND